MIDSLVVKLSGEDLFNDGFDISENIKKLINSLKKLENIRIGFVVGGGNICRGRLFEKKSYFFDQIGMLGTVINSMWLSQHFINNGISNKLLSSIDLNFIDKYNPELFQNNKTFVFAGGTGIPHVSTDITSILRAVDMCSNKVIKITKVDGIYDKDPKSSDAKLLKKISYDDYLLKNIDVMDSDAIVFAKKFNIKVYITNNYDIYNILKNEDFSVIGGTV